MISDHNSFQDIKRDLNSINSAQQIIQEDIERTCSKLPSHSSKYLNEKFLESRKYRERLVKKADEIQIKMKNKTLNSEIDLDSHLQGCTKWLNDLQSILRNEEELYQDSETVLDQLKTLQVIFSHFVIGSCCCFQVVLILLRTNELSFSSDLRIFKLPEFISI